MPKLPNTYVVIGTLLVVIGLYQYGHHKGWAERDAEMQSEIATKNEQARERETAMRAELDDTQKQLKDANDTVDQKQSALDRAISTGRMRLRSSSCVQASASPTAPAVDRNETQTESDRETLRLIAAIAADGDRAIVQLNACIDAYNAVREQVNGH